MHKTANFIMKYLFWENIFLLNYYKRRQLLWSVCTWKCSRHRFLFSFKYVKMVQSWMYNADFTLGCNLALMCFYCYIYCLNDWSVKPIFSIFNRGSNTQWIKTEFVTYNFHLFSLKHQEYVACYASLFYYLWEAFIKSC